MNIKQKILNALECNKLKLIEGKRNWYNYIISVQKLIWARNLEDGYLIDIYDNNGIYLDRIKITNCL